MRWGPDGKFGRTSADLLNGEANPVGLDRKDPAAADDVVTVNQLHLPVDKPAIIYLSSLDVIHSFGLNEMRVKQDAIPGMQTPLWFVPAVTTDAMRTRKGDPAWNYEINCAQLCGLGHYRMRGFLPSTRRRSSSPGWLPLEPPRRAPPWRSIVRECQRATNAGWFRANR